VFERGFKSWCENISLQLRRELGLTKSAPLPPTQLADYLEVKLWSPRQLVGLSPQTLGILLGTEKGNWSAVTVSYNGADAVIYNSTHSLGRRSSDIMHELAHLISGHRPATVILSPDGALALRSFDRQQEDAADWLSGCLLLPRPVLLHIAQSNMDAETACEEYGVNDHLLGYRMNITGVVIQIRRRAGKG
jgi:Zn-dependent peptidase ImmA (M78 family)